MRFAFLRGELDVAAVTEQGVRSFLVQESAEVRPRRVDHYRQAIDRFYKWLIAEGRVQASPASQLENDLPPENWTT